MKKICIIGVYFGKFPNYIDLFFKSCEVNNSIDFLIVTDQILNDVPVNVKVLNMTLENFKVLAEEKLKMKISLEKPYKCCDFKPVYGVILQEYITEYDFWGHCDFDLIFGDIRQFINEDILEKYDKILPLGHLCLYKNSKECNNRYKLSGSEVGEYHLVFSSNKNYAFDEMLGIYQIYEKHKFPQYKERVFADISKIYNRFRLALKDKNYKYQVFYWENGKIYRAYYENGEINQDEFVYIHFKKRKNMESYIENIENVKSFYITNKGFFYKELEVTLEDINKYNKYKGFLYEKYELYRFNLKEKFNAIKRRIVK